MDIYQNLTNEDFLKMERNQSFGLAPTFEIPDGLLEEGELQNYLQTKTNYSSQPFLKFRSDEIVPLSHDDFHFEGIETLISGKRFGGFGKGPIATLYDDARVRVENTLEDYVEKFKEDHGTFEEYLQISDKGFSFQYVQNLPEPEKIVDTKKTKLLWNISQENGLRGSNNPGINKASLYIGSKFSQFAWHLEDGNLNSINWHLGGAPKLWFGPMTQDIPKIEGFLQQFPEANECKVFHRHKRHILNLALFKTLQIPIIKAIQMPGEIIVTNSFHQGINLGLNYNLATNLIIGGRIAYPNHGGHCGPDCKYEDKSQLIPEAQPLTGYVCRVCQKVLRSRIGRDQHLRNEHDEEVEGPDNCPYCNKDFKELDKHIKNKHGDDVSRVVCGLCRKIFKNHTQFSKHWSPDHRIPKNYKCIRCEDEVFTMKKAQVHNCCV